MGNEIELSAMMEEKDPHAVIVDVGGSLAEWVRRLDWLCSEFHPELGYCRGRERPSSKIHGDLEDLLEHIWIEFANERADLMRGDWRGAFAETVMEIGSSVKRLNWAIINLPGIWTKLVSANRKVATIGRFHGHCYADVVADIGRDRYFSIFATCVVDQDRILEFWNELQSDDWGDFELPKSLIIEHAEDAIRALGVNRSIDVKEVRLQLMKERQRADGYVVGTIAEGRLMPVRAGRNEARDRWLYDEWQSGKSLKELMTATRSHESWEDLTSEAGVNAAIKRYAERNGLAVSKRR